MQSIRNRQIREILDEDMNINRQVFDREKEQVRVFQEDVLPKKTRDIEAEISVDKLIETLNKILENKLTSLEYLLSKIVGTKDIGDAEGRRSYNNVINNGDFIIAYNQLVRVYTLSGLSRASQEAIKVKFQEIKPNLDAIVYGLQELIQYLFESGKTDKDIFQLVRSQAVYELVNKQLYTGTSFKNIDQTDINISVKEVLSDLSDVQRAELKDISESYISFKPLTQFPIEVGNDEERIKQLEAELGFNLPRGELREYGRKEKEQALSEFGNIGKDFIAEGRQDLDNMVKALSMQRDTAKDNLMKVSAQLRVERRDLAQLVAQREQLLQSQRNFRADEDLKDNDIEREVPLSIQINDRKKHIESLRRTTTNLQDTIEQLTERIKFIKSDFEDRLKQAQEFGIAEEIQRRDLGLKKKKVRSMIPDIEDESMSGQGNPDTVKRHNKDYKHEPVPGFDDRRNDIYYLQQQLKRDQ